MPFTVEDENVEKRFLAIEHELASISATLESIRTTLVTADQTIQKVAAEVMPTLNQVMESPMLKMLTGGKRK